MIISSIAFYKIKLLYYFITIITILVLIFEKWDYDNKKIVIKNYFKLRDVIIVFLHNMHYFVYAFAVPVHLYIITQNYFFSGITCFINWILFLPRNIFAKYLNKYIPIRIFVALSFILSAVLLLLIGFSIDITIIYLCVFIQGIFSGVCDSFWNIESIKENYIFYRFIWRSGGVIGGIIGSIVAYFLGINFVYFIAALISLIGGILNIFIYIGRRKDELLIGHKY
jgi:hypothetical protein